MTSDCVGLVIREGGQCGCKGVHGLGKPCYDETVVHLDCGDEPTCDIHEYVNLYLCNLYMRYTRICESVRV